MTPSLRFMKWLWIGIFASLLPLLQPSLWVVCLAFWTLLVLFFLLDLFALFSMQPKIAVQSPLTMGVGDKHEIQIEVEWSAVFQTPSKLLVEGSSVLKWPEKDSFLLLPGKNKIPYDIVPHQRGKEKLHAIWLEVSGPFQMMQKVMKLPLSEKEISIVPSLPRVKDIAVKHFGAWQFRGGIRLEKLSGDGSELDALEVFRTGHDVRHIDWKASAKHQMLHVRKYRLERNQRIIFCMDCGHLMAEKLHDLQRIDHCIHAALLLSYFALKAGDWVGFYAYAGQPLSWLPPSSGLQTFQKINQACSALKSFPEETNHVLGMNHLLTQCNRRSLLIVFSDFVDTTTAELMIENMGRLLKKHLVLFVSIEDPLLENIFSKQPTELKTLTHSVVANELRKERKRVFQKLQKMGVMVAEGTPDLAAAQMVAHYVNVKRKSLLG